MDKTKCVRLFDDLGSNDVPRVGGKDAALGETLVKCEDKGNEATGRFATTAAAYPVFLRHNVLTENIKAPLEERREMAPEFKGTLPGSLSSLTSGTPPSRWRSTGSSLSLARRGARLAYPAMGKADLPNSPLPSPSPA